MRSVDALRVLVDGRFAGVREVGVALRIDARSLHFEPPFRRLRQLAQRLRRLIVKGIDGAGKA